MNEKHELVLRKAAAAIKDRGHEGDARLADSVLGVIAASKTVEFDGIKQAPAASAAPSIDAAELNKMLKDRYFGVLSHEDFVARINQHVAAAVVEVTRERDAARSNVEAFRQAACEAVSELAELKRAATAPVSEAPKADALHALDNLADEAHANGKDRNWINERISTVRAAFARPPVSEAGQAQPVAYLKTWNSVGNAQQGMRKLDFEPESEPWLANMFPTVTPLYATPQPAAMDEAAERAVDHHRERQLFLVENPSAHWPDTSPFPLQAWAIHKWQGWMARAALAAPQGNSGQADARYREGYADGWSEGRRDITAPQAAELPALPQPEMPHGSRDYFSAGQMRAYARAALALRQTQDEDAIREHLARVFEAMPADEKLRGSQIAGQIRAAKQAGKAGAA